MGYLTLEAAKVLRDILGFPQEEWPQMVWSESRTRGTTVPHLDYWVKPHEGSAYWRGQQNAGPRREIPYIAAPDDTTALMFCMKEHGWIWEYGHELGWDYTPEEEAQDRPWQAHKWLSDDGETAVCASIEPCATPSDLIVRIAAHHAAGHAATPPADGAG